MHMYLTLSSFPIQPCALLPLHVQTKVAPGSIKLLTPESVLILDGPDISVTGPIEVEGALVVRAVPGARVSLGPLQVRGCGGRGGWVCLTRCVGEGKGEDCVCHRALS